MFNLVFWRFGIHLYLNENNRPKEKHGNEKIQTLTLIVFLVHQTKELCSSPLWSQ